jgi:hypothetical protein
MEPLRTATLVRTVIVDPIVLSDGHKVEFRIEVFCRSDHRYYADVWLLDTYRLRPSSHADDADEQLFVLNRSSDWSSLEAGTEDHCLAAVIAAISDKFRVTIDIPAVPLSARQSSFLMSTTWLAEERLIWSHPDGRRVPGRIRVGVPKMVTDDAAECMLAIEGLCDLAFPMHGDSPLQVLLLALRHIGILIYDFLSRGGRVLDPLTGENFGIEHLFGPLLCPAKSDGQPPDDDAYPGGEQATVSNANTTAATAAPKEPAWIAQAPVIWLHPDGRSVLGRIAIGLPTTITEGVEADCMIALDGFEYQPGPLKGSTTLQAMLLAIQFVASRIEDFLTKGGRVLHPSEGSDFAVHAYFGALLHKSDEERARSDNDPIEPV